MNKRGEATAYNDRAMLRVIRNKKGEIVAFGRTRLGQAAYDCILSSMSAAEASRRHHLKREFILELRRQPHVVKMRAPRKKRR
jgi:hypothetical protein